MICNRFNFFSGLLRPAGILLVGMNAILLAGCNNGSRTVSDQQLQQDAQRATENAKQQSKEALRDARAAAQNAEGKVNAIASGVRQGLHVNGPSDNRQVDLNRASVGQLASLPGISEAKARQIVRHRPYSSAHQLVERGLLTRSEFDAIAPDVKVE